MTVNDILKVKGRDVSTTSPDTAVIRIVERLRLERIGALVVSRDGKGVEGVITERDIISAIAGHGPDALHSRARDVMTRWVRTCSPEDRVRDVMVEMTVRRVRHLPVVDHGQLCGIVSIGDVVKSRILELEHEMQAVHEYITHGR